MRKYWYKVGVHNDELQEWRSYLVVWLRTAYGNDYIRLRVKFSTMAVESKGMRYGVRQRQVDQRRTQSRRAALYGSTDASV